MNNEISHSSPATLDEWLFYLESIHATEIDMGLERISAVAKRLDIDLSASTVITVAGTNGKGTTCAFLEHVLLDLQHSVAVYSSPHIERFNERLRVNHSQIDDQPLIDAFTLIEQARGDISLTYYEYTTLAALMICQQRAPDFVILEVGLGGRLDATNIIDADISVITSIDLDHQAFLGDTREAIGMEKAGIARAGKPLVIGDPNMPSNVIDHVNKLGCQLYQRQVDFFIERTSLSNPWCFHLTDTVLDELSAPMIPRDNVATALTTLHLLGKHLSEEQVNQWIQGCQLEGRLQTLQRQPLVICDVAHNPHAARYLADMVASKKQGRVLAVVAMLKDKDVAGTLQAMTCVVDDWYVASLHNERGAQAQLLVDVLTKQQQSVNSFDNVKDAYKIAINDANKMDMVLIFGSFLTVAEIQDLF
ncbi:bifunctional tetrahydrofolate synthase/dihydrofolate synthase [Thalassotalea maritima]|uniref:bifunctional tetrahydrofolate synthase/dihydrofolate synthase n=1 Tax=Thalassotalea maritima TaxID=3242416 RepID=UPI003528D414